jgi:POT family proton-dependent oligopeptide transporter
MAIGIIIMGFGFFIYGFAAMEFEIRFFKHDMVSFSLFISYHWRACLSPVALSFITKLSPVKYASNDGSLFCGDRIRE